MNRNHWIIGITGLLLAVFGITEQTDGIVRYVINVVNNIGWGQLWQPVFDPAPMNTFTYRPLTVALVKLQLLLTGGNTVWMTAIHSVCIPWLGFATYRFLKSHNMEQAALWAALSTMALPSMLFSNWISVESDALGAIFFCEAAYLLRRWRQSGLRFHFVLFALAAFGAATTKETSAAAFFGYLLFDAVDHFGQPGFWRPVVIYGAVLSVLVFPLLMAVPPNPHQFHVEHPGFQWGAIGWMLIHNLTQLFYIASSAGIVLLFLLRRSSLVWLISGSLILCLAPPLRVYNHYESVVIDQVFYVAPLAVLMVGTLIWIVFKGAPEQRLCAGVILFLGAVLVVAPILTRQSRPDVSARLYGPVVPALFGLVWTAALRLIDEYKSQPAKWLVYLIVGCFCAFPVTGALNTVQLFRARMAVEFEAKEKLAGLLSKKGLECPVVIAPNRDHELASEELVAMGVNWNDCSELFIPNMVHLDPSPADMLEWKLQGHRYSLKPSDVSDIEQSLRNGEAPERCVYLYTQTPRAMMDTQDYRRFAGDFSWAFGRMPEFDEAIYGQQLEIQFRETTTTERLFRLAGGQEIRTEQSIDLFPLNMNELPRRLWQGLPIIESYAYEGHVIYFEKCLRSQQ